MNAQIWDPAKSTYRKVDQYDMSYTFPASGTTSGGLSTSPNLWLQTVQHTGYAADGTTTLAEPAMTFGGTAMANRVDWGDDVRVPPYNHFRLTRIDTGSGGETLVSYSTPACDRNHPPIADQNPYRCFPQYFKPATAPAGWGWFNKYVTTGVTDRDLTGGSLDEVWSYAYSTAGSSDTSLWHHDYNETTTLAFRSWSLWRGYPTVTVTHGASGSPQSVTTTQYMRGMDGDGRNSTDAQSVVWGGRRAADLTPLSTAPRGMTSAISGADPTTGGKCLDIAGGASTLPADGANVDLAACTRDPNNAAANQNQVWQTTTPGAGGVFQVRNPWTGMCLHITAGNVAVHSCTDDVVNEQWQHQPDGSLFNKNTNTCLDLAGASTVGGTNVDALACNGAWNQIWLPRDTGEITSPQSARCLDITGFGTTAGTTVETWTCIEQPNQQWQLQTNGTYLNPKSGLCLNPVGGTAAAGVMLEINTCTAAAGQLWAPQGDGTIKNPGSGLCIDAGTNRPNGSRPTLATCNASSPAQQWTGSVTDADGTQDFLRQKDTLDASTVVGSEVHTATVSQTGVRNTTVTGGQNIQAFMTLETDTQARAWIAASSAWRWTRTTTAYDGYGEPTDTHDYADQATSSDDTCTHTDYARNTSGTNYLIEYPSQATTTDCAATVGDADYLAGSQTLYDGSTTVGTAPTHGLPTRTNALASVSSGTRSWKQDSRTDYDTNGRTVASYDALNDKTTTAYNPTTGSLPTQTIVTDALGFATTTTVEPGHGSVTSTVDLNGKSSTAVYDPLGRLLKAWLNNRPPTATPDLQYTYLLSNTAANAVETQKLNPAGAQLASYTIYDGLMRERQTQVPAPTANGGRMIDDSTYDTRGLVAKTSQVWNNTSGPSATLTSFADSAVPTQHVLTYDNLGRPTVDAFYSNGAKQWQSSTAYQGDRSSLTPPAGGVPTQTLFDARGRVIELRQYKSSSFTGTDIATKYTYDRLGRLTKTTDSAGSAWTRTVDLRGNLVAQSSPDSGTSSYTYDDAGNLLTAKDANGTVLAYTYDTLGRKTGQYLASTTGTLLASWTYDSIAKGQLSSATSVVGGASYKTSITSYDDAYRPLGVTVTIPSTEGGLTGSWTTSNTYNVDGSPASVTYPAAGGLAAENVSYTYDASGYQLTAKGLDTYVSATTFQPWGDVLQTTLGSTGGKRVQVTTDEYPDTHRTKTIQIKTEDQTTHGTYDEQLTQQYNWDPSGDLTSVDSRHAGAVTDSQCFTYDYLQELATAWTTTPAMGGCAKAASSSTVGGPASYWTSWAYDTKTGNRKSQTKHGLSGAADTVSTYTYPAAAAGLPHAVSSIANTGANTASSTYKYNKDGQLTTSTVAGLGTDYAWTSQGQIASTTVHATSGNQITSYVYDAAGTELIQKATNGHTLYLGGTEIATNASGSAIAKVTRYYTVNGAIVAVRSDPGTLTWEVSDHQGTAQAAIDSTSLAVTLRRQDPFGNARGTQPAWPDPHGFVGGVTEATGLVHLGARLYDPGTGRFISPDHIVDVADPQQMNGYSYAENRPVSESDPGGFGPGSTEAHETAIMLRMAALQLKYPGAIIQGSVPSNLPGPDLVCWGCAPGKVWVWEFKSENYRAQKGLYEELYGHMNQAANDPLSAGMTVVEGPTFASLGLPPIQIGTNIKNPGQAVRVYDGDPGIQYYGTDDQDSWSTQGFVNHIMTMIAAQLAHDANEQAKQRRAAVPPATPRRPAPARVPVRRPPNASSGGGASHAGNGASGDGWTAADDYREAHRGGDYPNPYMDPGAVSDDAWGDAAIFGGTALVVVGVGACVMSIICGVTVGAVVLTKSMFTLAA